MSIFNQKPALYTLIRMIACHLIILCGAFFCIQTETYASTETDIVISDDPAEFALPEDAIDPLHGEKVVIDTETGLVESDSGKTSDIREVFDIPKKDADNLTLENSSVNKERISDYLDEKDIYVITDEGKEQLGVTFPFACKRILLFIKEGSLTESYGAYRVAYNTLSELYTLDYKTEEEAKDAFDHLVSEYGRGHVMVDLPVHCQGNTSAESEQFSETDALSVSWGNDMMHLDAVRDEANADKNLTGQVTVAVLDTGINSDHELFAGRLQSDGKSYIDGSSGTNDDSGHGSHVAGIIADGTSDHVKILPLKILDQKGQGGLGELIQAVDYAVSQNAGVINMSMGMSLQEYDQYWTYLDYQAIETSMKAANESGCICLAATGNDGKNMDPGALAMYPAISQYTFAVSSINSSKTRADNSNYGNCVDFTAPGVKIKSASASGSSDYCLMSGTSMAVPHLSAACAMLKLYYQNASVSQIKSLLLSYREDLGEQGKDQYYGEGLVVIPVSETQQDIPTAYDHAKADNVIDLIGNLPTNVSSEDEQTITKARNAYNALTKKQKTLIDAKTLAKLTDAEDKLKKAKETDQTAVGSVIARINALPAQITTANEAAVNAARAAYDALTPAQKALVSGTVKSKLTT
ncbi:MAG: S8 family serine peptidase, partial [Eubacterium sp.]|nr:S8 family serine peptidase [Eubacterium sp.]